MIIEIFPKTKKQMAKLSKMVGLSVIAKIRDLSTDQPNLQIKKMQKHKDMYRVRVGNYRIVYHQLTNLIQIVAVQHRKDVYREL